MWFTVHGFYNSVRLSTQHSLWDISSHRPIFYLPLSLPPRFALFNRAVQQNGENRLVVDFLQWAICTIFKIHMLWSLKPAIRDFSSHRPIFYPPLSLPTHVALFDREVQKNGENWILIDLLCFDFFTMINHSPFLQFTCIQSHNTHCGISHPTNR